MRVRALVLGLLVSGCASELASSAHRDDLQTFRQNLASAAPNMDLDELREVARAVGERELLTSAGDAGVARVSELAPCAESFVEPLQQLSKRSGSEGAAAIQVMIDAGLWSGPLSYLVTKYENDPRPAFRAVAARAAVQPSQTRVRHRGFLDGDLRVRRAALVAARLASNHAETSALLEAARLDPDPVARRFALEALSAMAEPYAMSRLRDVWVRSDIEQRRTITHAWGRERAYAGGGETQLAWVLSTQSGLPQLSAAVILLQNQSRMAAQAQAVLVRALGAGTPEERRYAAQFAPKSSRAIRKALVELSNSEDAHSASVAATALLRVSTARVAARKRLRELLKSDEPHASQQARLALAKAGDLHVIGALKQELASSDPEVRLESGHLLLWLQGADRKTYVGGALLADPAASVRTRFACAVLRHSGKNSE